MCNHKCDTHEIALGWPIENLDGELVCPSCYGEEAFCACGSVLPASSESSVCADCKDPSKVEYEEAKDRSASHNEMVDVKVASRAAARAIANGDMDADDDVENGNVWEVWGTLEDGRTYRVHLVWTMTRDD